MEVKNNKNLNVFADILLLAAISIPASLLHGT